MAPVGSHAAGSTPAAALFLVNEKESENVRYMFVYTSSEEDDGASAYCFDRKNAVRLAVRLARHAGQSDLYEVKNTDEHRLIMSGFIGSIWNRSRDDNMIFELNGIKYEIDASIQPFEEAIETLLDERDAYSEKLCVVCNKKADGISGPTDANPEPTLRCYSCAASTAGSFEVIV